MKQIVPFAWSINLFDIDIDFFVKLKVKYLFIDLDNTLDCFDTKIPSKKSKDYLDKLKESGLIPIIVSNNNQKRVKLYADVCGVRYLYRCKKPSAKKIKKFMKKENINKNDVIMIGDQVMTDIRCATRLGVKSILLEKLWPNEQLITKLLRWLDYIKRSRLRRNNLLINWREIYGRIK